LLQELWNTESVTERIATKQTFTQNTEYQGLVEQQLCRNYVYMEVRFSFFRKK